MHALVFGGTGFVGGILVNLLCARNDRATIVTRNPETARTARAGVAMSAWPDDVSKYDAVVNLAGASVSAKRWNEAYKRELVTSRVDYTKRLVETIAKSHTKPRVSASRPSSRSLAKTIAAATCGPTARSNIQA